MVRERDASRTSSGQYLSPQKPDRQPLANISAKIQSPSSKTAAPEMDDEDFSSLKPTTQAEFGKASPLRNPLKKHSPSSLFLPKKPVYKPSANAQFVSSAAQQAQTQGSARDLPPPEQRGFYMPGQRPVPLPQAQPLASGAPLEHALQRSFQPPQSSFRIPQPSNPPPDTSHPPSRPQFSSLGPNTYYQPFQPSKPVVDLTKSDGYEDGFDPDAAIRAEGGKFGDADPYAYVDATQANENIKNLLEGAFEDDGDVVRTRLRKRAKKAIQEGDDKKAKSLAGKLASLKMQDEVETESKATEPEEEDEDDGTVDGMAVKLLPHQMDSVSWMIDKEIGGPKKNGVMPHGGILADDMGLGKTIQSVALILTNPHPGPNAKPEHPKQKLPGTDVSKSTLVVAPLALIKQWEAEIKTKVTRSHALRVLVHHGPSRTKSARELQKYDVVITTYQTLTSEHAGSQMLIPSGSRIGCMGVSWYRIMLDEAHSIKNRNAKSTQACYAMNGWYRWCLSGTPMQNNLDELQSLIKFLRIKPYCELPKWKVDITQPMKNGRGGLAIKRLQYFLRTFMLRRTKDILKQSGALNFGGKGKEGEEGAEKKPAGGMQIVKREVVTVECEFDAAEKEFYDRLQDRADKRLQEMMKEKGGNDYIGALVLLLRLRQACNHSALIEMALSKDKETVNAQMASQRIEDKHASKREDDMDELTRLMGGVSVEAKKCDVCQVDLSIDEAREGAVRCADCNADILMMKRSKKKGKKAKKEKAGPKRKQHKLPDDSDDEGEGEWIAKGSEGRLDLGKAGGTDDEDVEGGGETLDSIDSEQSADDASNGEDSPPRARRRKPTVKKQAADDDSQDSGADSDASDSDSDEGEPQVMWLRNGLDISAERKPSTKIRHLLRILHNEAPEHKVIVFSQFTTMLDLMQPHLKSAGLRYVRYDGSMRNDAREASLNSLRTDPKTRVLLCSLKCGSLGLNLTAASRVVIVEPFWNPFVEEQAIDRVHRLNQTVDVKVYRLTVRDSVEEKILALQERKRELANVAIEGAAGNINKLTMKEILGLFKHDAVHSSAEHDEADREMMRKFGGDTRLLEGNDAGLTLGRDGLGTLARKEVRPERVKEHDVFGRRW
ncbi:hypothetical protein B0A55_09783 [Friedmanniomyces simplex]|uniref:ATP-dependent helicase n=1 Tax=Friedmanniomyces simplex TaxID=329884 RepID=A0A4U0WVC9_9PEZI|nr:hypothetical protein B0A55_09783 [Friedmanniomyces simplex]